MVVCCLSFGAQGCRRKAQNSSCPHPAPLAPAWPLPALQQPPPPSVPTAENLRQRGCFPRASRGPEPAAGGKQRFRQGEGAACVTSRCGPASQSHGDSSSSPWVLSGSGGGGEKELHWGVPHLWQCFHVGRARSPFSWGSQPSSLHPARPGHCPLGSNHWGQLAPDPFCVLRRPFLKAGGSHERFLARSAATQRDTKGVGVW